VTRRVRWGLILTGGVLALVPSVARAQNPQQAPPGQPPAQTDLILRREVFNYPGFARRNPFVAVTSVAEGEVSASELRLIGVILDRDPARSVAILGTSIATLQEGSGSLQVSQPGAAYYLRRGESLGNITLVEIHEDHVVVDVQEFGLVDRLTISLETGIPGGAR
jgi:hypothetical protein